MASRHRRHLGVAFACTGVLLASCGTAHEGSAVPDHAAVQEYVGAKYDSIVDDVNLLLDDFGEIKIVEERYLSVDDKTSDAVVTTMRVGDPPSTLIRNRSNEDSDKALDTFEPGDDDIEYTHLGRKFEELAPTPWVARPSASTDFADCMHPVFQSTCTAMGAFGDAIEQRHGSRTLRASTREGVELHVELSLKSLLEHRQVVVPTELEAKLSDEMRQQTVEGTLRLTQAGEPAGIELDGTIKDGEHEFVIRSSFQYSEPNSNDLPDVPPPSAVTELKTESEQTKFDEGLGKLLEEVD